MAVGDRIPSFPSIEAEIRSVFENIDLMDEGDDESPMVYGAVAPDLYLCVLHNTSDTERSTEVYVTPHRAISPKEADVFWARKDQLDIDELRRWLWSTAYSRVKEIVVEIAYVLGLDIDTFWPSPKTVGDTLGFTSKPGLTRLQTMTELDWGSSAAAYLVGKQAVGKTSLALRFARDFAAAGSKVAFLTEDQDEAMNRFIFLYTDIPSNVSFFKVDPIQGLGPCLKQAENLAVSPQYALVIFDMRLPWKDTLPRFAAQQNTRVLATIQAGRTVQTGDEWLHQAPKAMVHSAAALFWIERYNGAFQVLKHRKYAPPMRIMPQRTQTP